MMQPDHRPNQYGPQAYNSKRLPRLTREQVPLNRAPVLGQILNFGHTYNIIPHWILETEHPEKLKNKGKDTEEKKGPTLEIDFRWNHRSIRYDTVGSLTALVLLMSGLGRIFTLFCLGLFLILSSIISVLVPALEMGIFEILQMTLFAASIPGIFWLLGSIILRLPRKWWLRSSKGPQWDLCRETGLVTLFFYGEEYKKTGKPERFQAPFIEFEAVVLSIPNRHGGSYNSLALRHRQAPFPMMNFKGLMGEQRVQECIQFWHYIQNYMDTSKPLPDTPFLEEYRPYDPTTKAFDERTGRNPRYWRDMSELEFKAALEATKNQPEIDPNEHLCILEEQVVYGNAGALDSKGNRR